jgi:hypothetical protein
MKDGVNDGINDDDDTELMFIMEDIGGDPGIEVLEKPKVAIQSETPTDPPKSNSLRRSSFSSMPLNPHTPSLFSGQHSPQQVTIGFGPDSTVHKNPNP